MSGDIEAVAHVHSLAGLGEEEEISPNGMSMVVLSGDLDKALAAFIIANGAAAMDIPVTMFFTFWGLNILKRDSPVAPTSPKSMTEKMFGWMMPKGPGELKLSHLNMGGLGTRMMKKVMAKKHVLSLPELIRTAQDQGVRLIACTMTMDLMGVKKEELLSGIEYGGVGTFVHSADSSRSTLFI